MANLNMRGVMLFTLLNICIYDSHFILIVAKAPPYLSLSMSSKHPCADANNAIQVEM